MADDILFRRSGRLGVATLNRPEVLNALTPAMCRKLHTRLLEWIADPDVAAILLEGAGERAFSAGGDVVSVRAAALEGSPTFPALFHAEYRLAQAISASPTPVIALADGISMGAGAGLAAQCTYRIATERTLFAMPEAMIGLVPDTGMSHVLARFPGETGTWLGLTGARLKGADTKRLGFATHYIARQHLSSLVERLAHAAGPVSSVLDTFGDTPADSPESVTSLRDAIDYAFSHNEVSDILDLLDEGDEWAAEQAARMRRAAPTALVLALHALRQARHSSLADAIRLEYRMAVRLSAEHDFLEGVRVRLVDKDRDGTPRWQPASLADVELFPYILPPEAGDIDFR